MTRMVGPIRSKTWRAVGKILLATVLMCLAVAASQQMHGLLNVGHRFMGNLSRVVFGVGFGALVYFAAARGLKLEEAEEMGRLIRQKLGIQ